MLEIVETLANFASDQTAVRLAVWFHDAVYDSRAKNNEERSGELATSTLPVLGVPATTTAGRWRD